ncbi:MAG: S41 family peptidase [Candidatus Aminicenantes bacterium]
MRAKRRRIFLFTLLGAASLFFLLEGNLLKNPRTLLESDDNFIILARAINVIKSEYIEEPSPSRTMEGAFKGLVNSLDICSGYLNKNDTLKYKQLYGKPSSETGIILFKTSSSFPVIIGIKENSPAEKQGLQLGDTIGAVNGMSTLEMSMIEANLTQKSEKPDSIKIKILKRTGDEEISIQRRPVHQSLYSFDPDKGPGGILKINALFSPVTEEIKQIVIPQISDKKQPLIIDFRCCDQGDLKEAQNFINIFLQKKNIGYIETKENKKESVPCMNPALLGETPLYIWTNQSTMGASEAAASVLRKFRDAKVIGAETPGLMAVKTLVPLTDGSGIVLTTGLFHPYSKTETWRKGINPDFKIEGTDLSFKAYLEMTLKSLSES